MKRISVIIPVYNVEKYIIECVNSVIAQTYSPFEIILVDDGSTDKSGEICDKFQENNSNIIVLHKNNGGLSSARNAGINIARGEYVTYVDADDVISPCFIERLVDIVEDNNVDVSVGAFLFFNDGEEITVKNGRKGSIKILQGIDACRNLLYGRNGFYSSACCMLIKVEIAKNNLFPIGKYHEDELTTFRYYLDSNVVGVTDEQLYLYRQRHGSIMHSGVEQVALDELYAADNYFNKCSAYSKSLTSAARNKKYMLYSDVFNNYLDLNNIDELYYKVVYYLKEDSLKILLDFRSSISNKVIACKLLFKKII